MPMNISKPIFRCPYFYILPKHLHFYISIYHPVSMLNCYSCVAVVSILVIRKPTMIYDIKQNVFGNSYLYRCIVTCRLRFVILSRRVSKSFETIGFKICIPLCCLLYCVWVTLQI